jgi:hypothetical protein
MPRIELELDDKGEIVGDTPDTLKAILARIETTAHGQGYGKGVQKAAEDAKKQIADTVAAEIAKREAMLPIERAKWAQIDEDNKGLQTRLIETDREHDRLLKSREETHAKELLDRADALKTRRGVIEEMTKATLRTEARVNGARDESAEELEVILHSSIGYDDQGRPFVKNADGSPKTVHGKPQTIGAFVKEYLDSHAHHKKPASGTGGGARGGASFGGHSGAQATVDQARSRMEQGDRSPDAIDSLFKATRKAAS